MNKHLRYLHAPSHNFSDFHFIGKFHVFFLSEDAGKVRAEGKIKKSKKKEKSKSKEKIHKKAKRNKNGTCDLDCTRKFHFKMSLY